MADNAATGTTLHCLLNAPADQRAWQAFVDRYGAKIMIWCRFWGLQEADAENVTQDVLLKLARKLNTYDPGRGRFRGWLKTLAHRALSEYLDSQKRPGAGSGDPQILDRLDSLEARDDLAAKLKEEFDREVFEEAQARVRLRVNESTWEAFRLTALEGRSGAAAAAELKIKVAAVFQARSRVQQMLQEEVRRLDGGADGDEEAS
jgi:RNA polymerase sigma factor (sigma-70 family)